MTKEVTVRSITVHVKLLPCLDSVLYSFYFVKASSAYNNIIIVNYSRAGCPSSD